MVGPLYLNVATFLYYFIHEFNTLIFSRSLILFQPKVRTVLIKHINVLQYYVRVTLSDQFIWNTQVITDISTGFISCNSLPPRFIQPRLNQFAGPSMLECVSH